MENSVQLKHPAGKKAVQMDKNKYELLKEGMLHCLSSKDEFTQDEILECVKGFFKKNKSKFEGSLSWHMEWVKLDLEARKIIKRNGAKSPVKYSIIS
ncbi:MAG TPA: hypothetical protein VM012_14075 [Flavitalea sp.]|nr:hypothetical protein [Flavitalea sp.]